MTKVSKPTESRTTVPSKRKSEPKAVTSPSETSLRKAFVNTPGPAFLESSGSPQELIREIRTLLNRVETLLLERERKIL